MALVSYEYSGSENEEEEEEDSTATVILNKSIEKIKENEEMKESIITRLLPKSKEQSNNKNVFEDKLEDFIPKYQPQKEKPKEKVKITIPSLSEFSDEEDEPSSKRPKVTTKSNSGLLSMLPPVKGSPLTTKSFIPKSVAQANKPLKPQKVINSVKKPLKQEKESEKKDNNGDEDDDEDDDNIKVETFDEELWEKLCGRPKQKKKEAISEPSLVTMPTPTIDLAPEPEKPYEGLDNEAFKELVGKNRRPHLNYKLIDINEEEIVPDKDVWLTKSLTDPDQVPKPVIENPVDPTRRKKHHITYLAEKAKANEQQLQSQWSVNKHTRTQTRAKYGF